MLECGQFKDNMAMCLNDDRFSGPITIAEYMREVLTNPIQVKACALYMLSNQQIPIIVVVLQRYRTLSKFNTPFVFKNDVFCMKSLRPQQCVFLWDC